jgi:alpha-glucoside transport system substrate-binding protein
MSELGRRAFLAAGLAGVAGCTATADVLGLRPTVKIAVSWSGLELRSFRAVLDAVVPADYSVEIIPLGDDIAAAFGPKAPRRPDIVMLPQPGLVESWLADLAPLPPELHAQPYAETWKELVFRDGVMYGLPFKVAHKSAIWYRRSVVDTPPRLWSDWLTLNASLAADGIAPIALAAADGWVLTDFLENVLLGLSPATYERLERAERPRLSSEPEVARALRMLGEMWAAPGALAGGVDRSLVQQFPDAAVEAFGYRRAAMVVAPDFAEQFVRVFAADPGDVGIFTFPSVADGRPAPVVAGGDVAVLPRPASVEARDLVRRLAAPGAAAPWIRAGGFLSANQADGYSAELTQLAEQLEERPVAFDLSDQLGALGGSQGLQQVLQQFLTRIGGRGPDAVPTAVATTLDQLRELED